MNKLLSLILAIALSANVFAIEFDTPITRYENSLEKDLQSIQNKFQSKGAVTFASVGNGAECTHTSIQTAIDSGVDQVRVVHDHVYNENITIIADRDLLVRGTFSSCDRANNNIGIATDDYSIIEGSFGAVIIIDAPAVPAMTLPEITLWGFEVRNGTANLFADGGGVYMKLGVNADINLWSMDIHDNTSHKGGGISINGAGNISLSSADIHHNTAKYGGGLFCNNSAATIRSFDASITNNLASQTLGANDGQGGGIYASAQCVVSLSTRPNGNGIVLNKAEGQGGGVYASTGAKIYFTPVTWCEAGGTNCQKTAVNLVFNESDVDHTGNENGGGALITGANTLLRILDGNIQLNKSGGHGGAISIENGARLSTDISGNCWNTDHCLYFAYNFAGEQSFGAGGAIFNSSSIAEINNVTFAYNRADFGTVLYGTGLNSLTTIHGSIFNNNGDGGGNIGANGYSDNYVLRVISDAVMHVLSSTIADNNATLSVLGVSASATASSTIYSSIINDAASGNVFSNSSGYLTDCVLAHETNSFLSVGTSSVAEPSFVDRANRDYHILPTSLAVDACNNSTNAGDMLDIDLQPRGYDDPNVANFFGAYDIGADEIFVSEIIFEDGFE